MLLALDFHHQRADRVDRHRAGDASTSRTCADRRRIRSTCAAWCSPARHRRAGVRAVGDGARLPAGRRGRRPDRRRRDLSTILYIFTPGARLLPGARSVAAENSDLPRQRLRRLHVPARHRRAAVSAAAAVADRLSPLAVPVRHDHVHRRARLDVHEGRHHPRAAPLRLSQRARGQRAHQRRLSRCLRDVHSRHAVLGDGRRCC